MTLVVGVRCADGVVMGADSAATFGGAGTPTVTQPVRKLDVIDEEVIVGMSGHMGIHQLHRDSINRLWDKKKPGRNTKQTVADVQRMFTNALASNVERTAQLAQNLAGSPRALVEILTQNSVLVALPIQGRPELIECEWNSVTGASTDDLPYIAIGRGRMIADPVLAFLRRLFWDEPLTLSQGMLAVVWTLEQAIRVNPGGLGDPIQVAVLQQDPGESIKARLLSSTECEELSVSVTRIEEHISSYFKTDLALDTVAGTNLISEIKF